MWLLLFYVRRYSLVALTHCGVTPPSGGSSAVTSPGIIQCLRFIVKNEGPRALFKGLVPNLIGVAPSRAIYFCTYAETKSFFNTVLPPDSPLVHMCSAMCAGKIKLLFSSWFFAVLAVLTFKIYLGQCQLFLTKRFITFSTNGRCETFRDERQLRAGYLENCPVVILTSIEGGEGAIPLPILEKGGKSEKWLNPLFCQVLLENVQNCAPLLLLANLRIQRIYLI